MCRTTSIGILLSMTLFAALPTAVVPTQAAIHGAKVKCLHAGIIKAPRRSFVVAQTNVAPQRTCDWIGPGGRAVYVCKSAAVQQNTAVHQRTCDWVGPGGRAIYVCR